MLYTKVSKPHNPEVGDEYLDGENFYRWNGHRWEKVKAKDNLLASEEPVGMTHTGVVFYPPDDAAEYVARW